MSTYFMRQIAPMFDKPAAARQAEGTGSLGPGREEGAAEGGTRSAAGAYSAAAGSSHGSIDPQSIIIDDGDVGGAGDATEDDEATDSDGEKAPESSTDTDGQAELPLSSELHSLDERELSSEPELLFFQSPSGLICSWYFFCAASSFNALNALRDLLRGLYTTCTG
eukprot:1848058-Rhodomonas_salina.2